MHIALAYIAMQWPPNTSKHGLNVNCLIGGAPKLLFCIAKTSTKKRKKEKASGQDVWGMHMYSMPNLIWGHINVKNVSACTHDAISIVGN